MKGQIFEIISLLAIVGYFVPMVIMFYKKLWKDASLLMFAIYWSIGGMLNLYEKLPGMSNSSMEFVEVCYYMIAIPFVLFIYFHTTSSLVLKKYILILLPVYIVVEFVNAIFRGMNLEALKYILGVGLLLTLIVITWDIIMHLQNLEHSNRERSLMFINAAILFEYGTYVIIYIFDYFISSTDSKDSQLIYYISSIVAVTLASYGFIYRGVKKSVWYGHSLM